MTFNAPHDLIGAIGWCLAAAVLTPCAVWALCASRVWRLAVVGLLCMLAVNAFAASLGVA